MESYNQEESTNSSEEIRVDDQPSDQGVGRSYECVFCKRGFNTAQALGGHMNIHRKDKARNKPSSKDCSNKQEENNHYFGPRFYQQILPASPTTCYDYQLSENYNLSYATYFPESSTGIRSQLHQPENPSMNEDWRLSLSLDFTPRIMEDLEKDISKKEELDLELRLGYDTRYI